MIEPDSPEDVINRLRGRIIIPILDGLGPVDGMDPFVRQFPLVSQMHEDAAAFIERLLNKEVIEWLEVNNFCMELLQPADPFNSGKTYVVPILQLAATRIYELQLALTTES